MADEDQDPSLETSTELNKQQLVEEFKNQVDKQFKNLEQNRIESLGFGYMNAESSRFKDVVEVITKLSGPDNQMLKNILDPQELEGLNKTLAFYRDTCVQLNPDHPQAKFIQDLDLKQNKILTKPNEQHIDYQTQLGLNDIEYQQLKNYISDKVKDLTKVMERNAVESGIIHKSVYQLQTEHNFNPGETAYTTKKIVKALSPIIFSEKDNATLLIQNSDKIVSLLVQEIKSNTTMASNLRKKIDKGIGDGSLDTDDKITSKGLKAIGKKIHKFTLTLESVQQKEPSDLAEKPSEKALRAIKDISSIGNRANFNRNIAEDFSMRMLSNYTKLVQMIQDTKGLESDEINVIKTCIKKKQETLLKLFSNSSTESKAIKQNYTKAIEALELPLTDEKNKTLYDGIISNLNTPETTDRLIKLFESEASIIGLAAKDINNALILRTDKIKELQDVLRPNKDQLLKLVGNNEWENKRITGYYNKTIEELSKTAEDNFPQEYGKDYNKVGHLYMKP